MAASPQPTRTSAGEPEAETPQPKRPRRIDQIQHFWQRVTEGLAVEQLWVQFKSEAHTSYRLYAREVDAKAVGPTDKPSWWEVFKQFFWAILMKLSPVRRVLILIALVLVLTPQMRFKSDNFSLDTTGIAVLGGLLLLLVLLLETADRVTMKRDLQIAREIQNWLVPDAPPEIPGMDVAFVTTPANTVAGDFFDVFRKPAGDGGGAGRVLITVADVAGKSIPAALLMATFQASLQTLSATPCTLQELVSGLNRYACAHSNGGRRFTTAFVAELDPVSGELEYTNCGHNAPILRRASGELRRLSDGGLPLGIKEDGGYECGTEALGDGDVLLIFTDGLVEAENAAGAEYEEARMLSVLERCASLSANDMFREMMEDVNRFVGGASQHDDITCMVVKFVGKA